MNEELVLCESVIEYITCCADPARAPHVLPIFRDEGRRELDGLCPGTEPAGLAKSCDHILRASIGKVNGVAAQRGATVVAAAGGPASVCAAFLAASTGRPLHILESLNDISRAMPPDNQEYIVVASLKEADDRLLLSLLDQLETALDTDRPRSEWPRVTLVTGRDLASLSRMVAKLVAASWRSPAEHIRLRHYSPEHDHSFVRELQTGDGKDIVHCNPLSGPALLASYGKPTDVMAFRTHGSEACANGGDGTVLCGLRLPDNVTFEPLAKGVLACGWGLPCPRGPHPFPLEKMATDVLMLGTCNGLRLADSLTRPQFNFALSFVDGPGIAFVSSLFSSVGGDVASIAFLAAMATGLTLGESTTLINALLRYAGLERTTYLAVGDVEHRVRRAAPRTALLECDTLPPFLAFGDSHFVELRITDAALVDRVRHGRHLTFAAACEDHDDAPYGFHRVERRSREDGRPILVLFLFSFPQPLGRVRIEAADPEVIRGRARVMLDVVRCWTDLWRLAGIEAADPEAYDELRRGAEEIEAGLGRSLALLTLDGGTVARVERQLELAEKLASAACAGALEHLTPQLQGSFWLSNLHTAVHQFGGSRPIVCPHCRLTAMRRTMRHVLTSAPRSIVVCPRCGICTDIPDNLAIEEVIIEGPHTAMAGQKLIVTIVVRLTHAAILTVHPRLSTHGEDVPPPEPDGVSARIDKPGEVRLDFAFQLPLDLSPHRHYVKVLLATTDGLAFASRPFFVHAPTVNAF